MTSPNALIRGVSVIVHNQGVVPNELIDTATRRESQEISLCSDDGSSEDGPLESHY